MGVFKRILLCMVVTLVLGLGGQAVLAAQNQNESDEPQPEQQVEPAVSQREAADRVRERYEGRLLNIRREGRRWRVRMDNDGTVFNVFVDARTGEVAGPSE